MPPTTTISRIGPYRLMHELGQGGMGVVYLAERDDQFHQRVAVKIVRHGLDTPEMLDRFQAERQILASLNHPNISRLLDGGVTADGRPYFVLEYVEGEPIDVYCRRLALSSRERVRLFLHVARAVHYAHRNLIVHRDLKPTNILVAADGQAKLLDFGIAKILDAGALPLAGPAPQTQTGLWVMTPEYASPEQVRGDPVYDRDRRVWSRARALRDPDGRKGPEGHVARAGRAGPGDLRNRPSAAAHRRSRPHRGDGAPQGTGAPLRLGGASGRRSGPLSRRGPGRGARRLAAVRRAEVRRAPRTGHGTPAVGGGGTGRPIRRMRLPWPRTCTTSPVLTEQGQLDEAGPLFEEALAIRRRVLGGEHVDVAESQSGLGWLASERGDYPASERRYREALEMRRRLLPPNHPEIAYALHNVATSLERLGRYDEAERLHLEALAVRRQVFGDRHPSVATGLNNLGIVLLRKGDQPAAVARFRDALAMGRELLGEDHPSTLITMNNLAAGLTRRQAYPEAEELLQAAIAAQRRKEGPESPALATSLTNLATVQTRLGKHGKAEANFRTALAMERKAHGDEHPGVASTTLGIGILRREQRRYAEADSLLQAAIAMRAKLMGADHPETKRAQGELATLYERWSRRAAADSLRALTKAP